MSIRINGLIEVYFTYWPHRGEKRFRAAGIRPFFREKWTGWRVAGRKTQKNPPLYVTAGTALKKIDSLFNIDWLMVLVINR
jgi:hypothetical protein